MSRYLLIIILSWLGSARLHYIDTGKQLPNSGDTDKTVYESGNEGSPYLLPREAEADPRNPNSSIPRYSPWGGKKGPRSTDTNEQLPNYGDTDKTVYIRSNEKNPRDPRNCTGLPCIAPPRGGGKRKRSSPLTDTNEQLPNYGDTDKTVYIRSNQRNPMNPRNCTGTPCIRPIQPPAQPNRPPAPFLFPNN